MAKLTDACPVCGDELAQLYESPDCDRLSQVWECRRCSYPHNRWLIVLGEAWLDAEIRRLQGIVNPQ